MFLWVNHTLYCAGKPLPLLLWRYYKGDNRRQQTNDDDDDHDDDDDDDDDDSDHDDNDEDNITTKKKPWTRLDITDTRFYEGELNEDDEYHGLGVLRERRFNTYYVGDWEYGMQTGKGIMVMPGGVCYEGGFEYSRFHGRGVMQFPDGKRLTAKYVRDNRKGTAKMEWPCGDVWEGRFESDNISIGLRKFAETGDTLEGVFVDVELNNGSLVVYTKLHSDGKREEIYGIWIEDRFIPTEEELDNPNRETAFEDHVTQLKLKYPQL